VPAVVMMLTDADKMRSDLERCCTACAESFCYELISVLWRL